MFANREKKVRGVGRPRAGFTLLELIIVIGIIGVLSAILLGQFSGITESARAAECMSHLRNLSSAVHNYGMMVGYYPFAGDCEYRDSGDLQFRAHKGFISCNEDFHIEYNRLVNDNRAFSSDNASKMKCTATYNGDSSRIDKKMAKWHFCVTNGAIWKCGARRLEDYRCPSHVKDVNGAEFGWSYVMNSAFGYDYNNANRATGNEYYTWRYGECPRPDKRLLFAELPWYFDNDANGRGRPEGNPEKLAIDYHKGSNGGSKQNDTRYDGVLQFKDSVNDSNAQGAWPDGDAESIGFNHILGKGKNADAYAHVCFLDGHTEKLRRGAMNKDEMLAFTAWLCRGYDVRFNQQSRKWSHDKKDEE